MRSRETVQRIKNEYDIIDYIRTNGVDLESSGGGQWKGLCPFHNEKTPSFVVSEQFQSYKCFGCGQGGDILQFAQETHGITFLEALNMLAEEKGIEIGKNVSGEPQNDINGIRQTILDAETFFRINYDKLDNSHGAKQEIIKRGLDVNNKLYGYSLEAPNALYNYLKDKGHSDKNIKDSNLVIFFKDGKKPWDFFHGRLMITLKDYLGRPISFTSRKIFEDDKMSGKYVNGKESPIFQKKTVLFGSDTAKKSARENKQIYVVEGQFDQISMYENGVENVVATSGTAFTEEHANLLLRMVGQSGEVIFIMDGDSAGIKAAIKVFKTAKTLHANAKAVLLGNKKDPCDYIEEGGIGLLEEQIVNAVPLHDFVINALIKELGEINISNRHRFVSEVAKFAKSTIESFIIDDMLSKASVMSAISIDNVKEIYNKTEVDKVYVKQTESTEETLNPIIVLNDNSEADICMYSALAMLVRMPGELLSLTPERNNKKFRLFLSELKDNYRKYREADKNWRFIAEDYTDIDFAKLLQSKVFLEAPETNIKASKRQYSFLFKSANNLYQEEYERMRMSKALSSILNKTNAVEIAKAMKLYSSNKPS